MRSIIRSYVRELHRYYREHGFYPFTYLVLPLLLFAFAIAGYSLEGDGSTGGLLVAPGASAWLAGTVVAVVATLLILPSFWGPYWQRRRILGYLTLWIVASTFVLPGSYVLHLLSLAVAARLANVRQAVVGTVVVITVATLNVYGLWEWLGWTSLGIWFSLPPMLALMGWLSILDFDRERKNARLRLAQAQTEQLSASQERDRIGRDLHDLLGHSLTLISVKAELVDKLGSHDVHLALRENQDVIRIARTALAEVRQVVEGYRAPRVATELANADLALRSAGVRLEVDATALELEPEREAALAFVLRECVTNVMRHAEASRCRVSIASRGDVVALAVEDNGRGGSAPDGSGTRGMRERVEALGGSFRRTGERGTRVEVTLPRGRIPREEAFGGTT